MLHSGGGGILDGSGGGAKVTPPTKGLGIIVTPVRRYIGERNMCIQEEAPALQTIMGRI